MSVKKQLGNLQQKQQGRHSYHQPIHQPLPIVIESLSGFPANADAWPCYRGIFTGHSILVSNKGDAKALYSMGCFGNPQTSHFHSEKPPILRQRQFDRRQKWARLIEEKKSKRCSSESEDELQVPDIMELHQVPEDDYETTNCEIETAPTGLQNAKNTIAESDLNDDVIVEQEVRIRKGRNWFSPVLIWTSSKEAENVQTSQSPRPHEPQVIDVDDEITILSDSEESAKNVPGKENQNPNKENLVEEEDEIEIITEEEGPSKEEAGPSNIREEIEFEAEVQTKLVRSNEDDHVEMITPDEVQPDKFLEESDVALVIKDSDCNGSKETLIKYWNPQVMPCTFKNCDESTTLSLEEAFFLSWSLNCLQISASKSILCEHENSSRSSPQPGPSGLQINEALIDLSPSFAWSIFVQTQPNFPARYAVYHHLRSKGWVVRSGCKFGGDFVIYKEGPKQYHASSVVVVETEEKKLSWQRLFTLNRIAETTSKEVVVCKVSWPCDSVTDDLCWLSNVSISDRVFQRHAMKRGAADEEGSEEEYSDASDL